MNKANKITMSRVIMSIIIIVLLLFPFDQMGIDFPTYLIGGKILIDLKYIIVGVLFIIASFTDFLDGYIARKYNMVTDFGKMVDAISDKLYFLSLIIILLVNKKYLIILPMIMELIISIINYLMLKKNKKVFTERVGKFKTTLLIITLIAALLSIEIKIFNYLYIIFLVLTTYFHIETICAYINQLHGKSKENIVSFKDKKISERIKLLLDEFMQYIKNPIKIIK